MPRPLNPAHRNLRDLLKAGALGDRRGFRLAGETKGLASDSLFLAFGNGATIVGMMAQILLITRVLGLGSYGVFATVVAFVAIVDRFFDVQVGEAMIAHAAAHLHRDARRAAGVAQYAYAVDFAAGIAGFVAVAALTPVVAERFAGPEGQTLFVLYAATLLLSTVDTTSLSLLRLFGRFSFILKYILMREALRIALVAVAVAGLHSLTAVVLALVILDAFAASVGLLAAAQAFRQVTGISLFNRSLFARREERRSMLRMLFHTNFVSYANLVVAQGPTLALAWLGTPVDVGLFKVGTTFATGLGKILDSAWNAVMPRLSRLWSEGRTREIRELVYQATILAGCGVGSIGFLLVLLRGPLLRLLGGHGAEAAGAVLILAVAAKVVDASLFWNTSLLYAAKEAASAARAYVAAAVVFVPAVSLLVWRWGAEGAAGGLLLYSLLVNTGSTIAGLRLLRPGRDTSHSALVPSNQ